MSHIRIVVESGSDISPELAAKYGISVVPMHVAFDDDVREDGTFDPQEVVDFYTRTGRTPKTSGSNTEDFSRIFDQIHSEDPEAGILYLAYSAATTVSYSCGVAAMEGRDYVRAVDTKMVTIGQAMIAVCMAEKLLKHPEWDLDRAKEEAEKLVKIAHVSFVPRNLDYLRAGGRCTNSTALIGNILHIVPLIDTIDGLLVATKKYRGRFSSVITKMMTEYTEQYHLSKDRLFIALTPGFEETLKEVIRKTAENLSYHNLVWLNTGGVITTHGGAGAFGIAGLSEDGVRD